MKRIAGLIGLSIILAATLTGGAGCDSAPKPPPTLYIDSGHGKLLTYGTIDFDEKIIKESLEHMHQTMIESPRSLTIGHEQLAGHFGPREAGHFHRGTHEVCIWHNDLWDYVVWHEFAHAYHATLPAEMSKEWLNLVVKYAGKDAYKANESYRKRQFPYQGFVTRYGTTNLVEDVAEWHSIMKEVLVGRVYLIFGMDKSNPIYMGKLNLLFKWKFITQDEYETLKKIFENI